MKAQKLGHVFVIDDDADYLEFICTLLQNEGFEVTKSVSSLYSISEINTLKPDYLLTDLVMSEVNGLELCNILRENKNLCHMKIILMTARTDQSWWEKASALGANGFIQKPINIDSFVENFKDAINSRPIKIDQSIKYGLSQLSESGACSY